MTPTLRSGETRTLEPRRILIIKMSAIGDVAHTIPISFALHRRWPDAAIDWLVASPGAAYVELLPWIERVFRFDLALGRRATGAYRLRELVTALRGLDYDLVVDFQGLLRSSLWTVLCGARLRLGRGRWPWLHESVPMYAPRITPHAIENTARPLISLGLEPERVLDPFEADAAEPLAERLGKLGRRALERLELEPPFWVWLTQSSWSSKTLEPHDVSRFPRSVTHLVIGDRAYRGTPLPERGDWRDLSGLPLPETAGLCLLARRTIGVDTGPAHFAALVGARIHGCFGPTSVERHGLRGPRARNFPGACTACYRRRCRRARQCLMRAVEHAVDFDPTGDDDAA